MVPLSKWPSQCVDQLSKYLSLLVFKLCTIFLKFHLLRKWRTRQSYIESLLLQKKRRFSEKLVPLPCSNSSCWEDLRWETSGSIWYWKKISKEYVATPIDLDLFGKGSENPLIYELNFPNFVSDIHTDRQYTGQTCMHTYRQKES